MAGIDLHSNNLVIGIVGLEGKRLGQRKLDCELKKVVEFLAPYKKRLEAIAVESTYNWYWLVDGLAAAGYPVVLANPAGMQQYSGLKHSDDASIPPAGTGNIFRGTTSKKGSVLNIVHFC